MKKKFLISLLIVAVMIVSLTVGVLATDASATDGTFAIEARSISLKDAVRVNFKVTVPNGADISTLRLLVWEGKPSDTDYDKATTFSDVDENGEPVNRNAVVLSAYTQEANTGYYVFQYAGIAAKEMGKTLYARAYYEDGGETVYTDPVRYSVAQYLYNMQHIDESAETRENRVVCSYAFAVSEQNASGETIVTAPTCGASGVVPAVLYYQQQKHGFSDFEICKALAAGGVIGNLIKTNASISGAEAGCQAEIGTACAMASAALGELFGLHLDKIEYAAEIAVEHHLGLTCDPIGGLVQIPCIERNAVAAMRAINAVNLASFLSSTRKISLDNVIIAMRRTGRDIHAAYRETSEGGLAALGIE